LCQIAEKYGTDKGLAIHGYTPHYNEAFEHRRHAVRHVFELGICGPPDVPSKTIGASLRMWADYFPNATITGVDVNPKWMVRASRIYTFMADETHPYTMSGPLHAGLWIGNYEKFGYDLIIDDAIHDPKEQLLALNTMLPFLADDGIYAMEDVCPWKLPNDDLHALIDTFPDGLRTEVFKSTHKGEYLFLIKKVVTPGSYAP